MMKMIICSASTTLPGRVSASCSSTTCTTLTAGLATNTACLTDPTDTACTTTYSAASTFPGAVASLSSSLTPVTACMTDPTATACTGTYSAATTLPALAASTTTLATGLTAVQVSYQTKHLVSEPPKLPHAY